MSTKIENRKVNCHSRGGGNLINGISYMKYRCLLDPRLHGDDRNGFTLIELLIVIAILGVLAATFIATFPASQKRARDSKRQSDIKQYQTALEQYANKKNGNYPSLGGPVTGLCGAATLNIPNCPDDPKAPTVRYQYLVNVAGTSYVLYATLEASSSTYFVTCSSGKVGTTTTAPTSSTCPPSL